MSRFGNRDNQRFVNRYAPGHFYSPLPSFSEIDARKERIFDNTPTELPGIDLHHDEQVSLLQGLSERFLAQMPDYKMKPIDGFRFHHNNNFYSRKDAALLYCMMRHLQPRRIVEVGSGFSSAMILDTNEHYFDNSIELTFIEPYPERLYDNIRSADREVVRILKKPVQDVPLSEFAELSEGDILFIDSSHVTKIGSDVNYLLFTVLPYLNPGVFIHFHDIFYPFEYLQHWVEEGRAWNEAYILRAFLQYNPTFQIRLFTAYLLQHAPKLFETDAWGKVPEDGSRSSFWMQKTKPPVPITS